MKHARLLLVAAALIAACSGRKGVTRPDAGSDGIGVQCLSGTARGMAGATCACSSDCASGFCVDGVCCTSACTGSCKACDVPGSLGTCSFVPSGVAPHAAGTCAKSSVSSCGLDGTCDGKGACARYPAGVVCTPGTCQGSAVGGENVCDGQGRCRPGPATVCAPFGCDPTANACHATCTGDTDCAAGIKCVNGSCGPKPTGAVCTKDGECASGFCTDGVCCNVACRGACTTCNQPGRVGTCWAFSAGRPDPHHVCADQGAASCGQVGTCDGIGGCSLYAAETVCVPPSCGADRLNTAGTCDGRGSCRTAGVRDCVPFRCAEGACISRCTSDDDCSAGHACQNGSCGKKGNGQVCAGDGDCASNHCVDGVCCADACVGPCKSCALPSALGQCTPVAAGSDDPRGSCAFQPVASCGTDGKCDGAGACRRYRPGTPCAAERCESSVYTPAATCDAAGNCLAPDAIPCPPFACNGSKCFGSCAVDANCSPGNVCVASSCGRKAIGAFCGDKSECASGICAQGVCCATACTGACRSCALAGTMGQCTNVPKDGLDPTETCIAQPAETCGTTGKCEAGACQKHGQGVPCRGASCPAGGTLLTPGGVCDGAGVCVVPAPISCFPFGCGAAACNSTCRSDDACAPSTTCSEGSCGLKPPGGVCATGAECASGVCAQGVCCLTTCTGSCRSCAVSGHLGTCSPVPLGGTDPAGACTAQGAATCGTTGVCDGAGSCQLYSAGTQCAAPTCPNGTTTATLARACDGAGACKPAATQSCGSYACNGVTCNAACGGDADCAPGKVCVEGSCGGKRLGQLCVAGSECDSGNCVDGVCCAAASCGSCLACNVTGKGGTCQPVPADEIEPHARCPLGPVCGFDGKCDGLGACRNASSSTSCGAAACSGTSYTSISHCTGTGSCAAPTPVTCAPYLCGAQACLASCTGDDQCVPGDSCQSGSCTNLRPNGAACTTGVDCISTHCTDGVCCAAASCGSCAACALPGKLGTCAPVPAGMRDPAGVCAATAASTCGTTGACNGAGQCVLHPAGTSCGSSSCSGGPSTLVSSTCDGAGKCVQTSTDCGAYKCDSTALACRTRCSTMGECTPGYTCTDPTCIPK